MRKTHESTRREWMLAPSPSFLFLVEFSQPTFAKFAGNSTACNSFSTFSSIANAQGFQGKIHCRHQVTRHDSVVSVLIVIAVAIATSVWRWRTMASFPGDLDSLAATTICDRPLCQISAFDLYGLTPFCFLGKQVVIIGICFVEHVVFQAKYTCTSLF